MIAKPSRTMARRHKEQKEGVGCKLRCKPVDRVLLCSVQHPGKIPQNQLAGELGFEPRLAESESAVLPLNYSPAGAGQRVSARLTAELSSKHDRARQARALKGRRPAPSPS
jgi:hypothetical protein